MERKKFVFGFLLVIIIAFLAYLVLAANTGPGVVSPAAGANVSGTLLINLTSSAVNISNITVFFFNGTDNSQLVYNTTLFPRDVSLNTTFNQTIATVSILGEGTFNMTFNATNGTDGTIIVNESVYRTSKDFLAVDNTTPTVTINTGNNSYVNTGGNVLFNVTITNDTGFTDLLINAASGADAGEGLALINTTGDDMQNIQFARIGDDFTFALNSTSRGHLIEGPNTFTVHANDTAENSNDSESIIVFLDTEAPDINLTKPINYSWVDNQTPEFKFNFVDNSSTNASCTLFIDDTAYGTNATLNNGTQQVISANASISNGVHSWYVNCTDLANNNGTAQNKIHFFDVTNVTLQTPTNNSYNNETKAGNVSFKFLFVSGLFSSDQNNGITCNLLLANSSGNYIQNGANLTSTLNNTQTKLTNNQTLVNGLATNWSVNCTFNGTNIGPQSDFLLNVDNSSPSITLSRSGSSTSSKLVIDVTTENTASTCTTDRAGASVTGSGASQTITEGSLNAETSYSYTVTCTDAAENSNSKTQSFKTGALSTGGGTGGSGGGASTGVTGQFEKKVWSSLFKGEKASVPVKNGKIGVTEVSFDVKQDLHGVWVNIVKKDAFPSTVQAALAKETKVYRRLDISRSINLQDKVIQNAQVKFKVEKSWLSQQNLLSVNVALLHYDDAAKQWKELPTTVASDDGTYVHFVAETPGFSYFAIGSKAEEAAPPTAQEPAETAPAEAPAGEMPAEAAPAEQIPGDDVGGQGVLWTIVVLVVIGLIAWWLIKRNK